MVLQPPLPHNGVVDFGSERRDGRVQDRARLAGHARSAPQYPLRGRAADVIQVRNLLESSVADGTGPVLLRGQSGIGKTRLLAAALDRAAAAGWSSVVVTPDADSTTMPLGALLDGAAQGDPPLLDIDAVTPVLQGAEPQYWVTRMLTDSLQRLSRENPVLFVVDDAHWLDSASLAVLAGLMRSLEGEQIAWLFASRTGVYRPAHGRLIERIRVTGTIVELSPLSADAASEIAADILGGRPGPALEDALERTTFIPLLVVELVRGLREESLLERRGVLIDAVSGEVPARYGSSLRERLRHLTDPALRFVQVSSLFGRRFRLLDVLAVLDTTAATSASVVEELITNEIIADDGTSFVFLHDALREGAEATLSPSLRKALSREVVGVRLASGESPTAITSALIDAAEPGDDHSFTLLHEAAVELAGIDAVESSRLAAAAIQLTRGTPRLAAQAAALIPILWAGGRGEDARAATRMLEPHLSSEDRARSLLAIARQQTESSFDDAITAVDDALQLGDVSRSIRAELLAVRALNAANKADAVELRRSLDAARATADVVLDSKALATIDATESVFEFYRHHWDLSMALISDAFVKAERSGVRPNLWMPEGLWPTFVRNAMGETGRALKLIETGMRETETARNVTAEAFWTMTRSRVLLDAGRLDDARLQAETVMDLAAELGLGDFANATAGVVMFKVALHTGDRALTRTSRAVVEALAAGSALTRAGRWALAVEAFGDGRLEDAYALSDLAVASLRDPVPAMSQPVDLGDELVLMEILLHAEDEDGLLVLQDITATRAEENPGYPFASAIRDVVRGRIHNDSATLEHALDQLRGVERPLVRARALEIYHRVCEHDQRSRTSLEEALQIYEECGAVRDASRVLALLRDRGVRRRPAQASRAPLLSSRETQVLEHLLTGATTQQIADALFVSPHTVVTHVRHIYAKLGVSSRKELLARHAERTGR